jgi:leucyl aminopeptidase
VLIPFDKNDYASVLTKIDSLPKAIKSVTFHTKPDNFDYQKMAYYWAAHYYNFDYYKKNDHKIVKLYIPELSPKTAGELRALFLGRNAINLPSEDLTPEVLQTTLESFALEFGATTQAFVGLELLDKQLNLIHAVGRGIIADNRQPRLIDFYYKTPVSENAKTITLVGKGVCFDNGGLNIKTGNSMGLMKKDMGGAATVLAVGLNLLLQKPDFNLRILIPAVENNIHANSFRPGDIYTAFNGKTVEITNTDAEGRLILGDAIAYAAQDNPDLLVDVATLTGAARVALGADLPVLYSNNPDLVPLFMQSEHYHEDPVWELPLWKPYDKAMRGTISDLINSEAGGMAGSIKAALFIQHFIGNIKNWIHFDSYCYVQEAKPARPKGGDVMPYLTLSDAIHKFAQR